MTKVNVPNVSTRKTRNGAVAIAMITAYDAPSALAASDAGIDMMVVLGYDDTLQVTIEDMAHHTRAVARAKPDCLIVGDLPWMSYHVSVEETIRNAAELIRAGAQCVKLEGGRKRVPMIEALIDAEIPVMGHIGLTPQSVHAMGGFKVQARSAEAAIALVEDAKALEHAGCFAMVLEGIPVKVAAAITEAVGIPTIGIGAGPHCDGQVLVLHDVLGIEDRFTPKFVRRYADLKTATIDAISSYVADVRSGAFPNDAESYHLAEDQAEALDLHGRQETQS